MVKRMGETPVDILPDPESPAKGWLRRGIGFCGALFLVIGFMSLMSEMNAISSDVGPQYMIQAALALAIGFILTLIQLRMEK
ncbi:MAG: hypothetical protein C4K48_10210 [Candidatus Thorarchaeota archaeon]|nr:MAG: hypothetical protein C4K48_10210 [Candidatus Thorarchaeota archaeon]